MSTVVNGTVQTRFESEKSSGAFWKAVSVGRRNFSRGGKQCLLPILTIGTGTVLIFVTQIFTGYLRVQAQLIAGLFGATGNSASILSSTYWISTMVLIIGTLESVIVMSRNVVRRTREIGIMKAVGVGSNVIATIIQVETFLYGVMGGLVGIAGGVFIILLVGLSQFSLDPILVLLPAVPQAAAYAFILSVIPSMAAGVYPSYRAIRLSVLEAISHEV
jgi:ABC-type antimicrobial peptide transport system permease subunit